MGRFDESSPLYRKARKLLRDPVNFVRDSKLVGASELGQRLFADRSHSRDASRIHAYMWGFHPWKREHVARCFPQLSMEFLPSNRSPNGWARTAKKDSVCIVWGYSEPDALAAVAAKRGIPIWRMEDGFVRSQALGASHAPARSLVLDKSGSLYFDARAESGLEHILKTHDFGSDTELLASAARAMETLLKTGVSKYNADTHRGDAGAVFEALAPREEGRPRILLIGQVEDDASLRFGLAEGMSNLDLAIQARKDHPNAQLFYRPHPDVVSGHAAGRPQRSTLAQMAEHAHVITESMSLANALSCVDRVYTLTSLAGFEALMRDLPVTVLGCPFYAGWGLTDDRKPISRRGRKLSTVELFAGAYGLYPSYFEPDTGSPSSLQATIAALANEVATANMTDEGVVAPAGAGRRRAVAFHVGGRWRPAIRSLLPEYTFRFARLHEAAEALDPEEAALIRAEHAAHPDLAFVIWGYFEPQGTLQLARELGCEVHRFEDGFIRSVGLGAEPDAWGRDNLPLSLVVDKRGMYFDARRPSDIEALLMEHDFDEAILARAERCIARIVDEGITKYNTTYRVDAREIYGDKTCRRVLVTGQVESDASIRFGCEYRATNNDLVLLAVRENPDAEVIYKPHPAVLRGAKGQASDPRAVAGICRVLHEDISLPDALSTIDHVYTITSTAGFEALLRGIPVTCLGANFYAGWGLTDDRMPMPRRTRRRSLAEVFAGFYLLYSRYYDHDLHRRIELEDALDLVARGRLEQRGVESARRGQRLLADGDAEEARRHLCRAVELNDEHPPWFAALGAAQAALGRHAEALVSYDRALQAFPEDGDWRLARANVRMALGERSDAVVGDFRSAISLLKRPAGARAAYLSYLLQSGGEIGTVVNQLHAELERSADLRALQAMETEGSSDAEPENAGLDGTALGVLAIAEWSCGELELGLERYAEILARSPGLAHTLFPLRAMSEENARGDWPAMLLARMGRALPEPLIDGKMGALRLREQDADTCEILAPGPIGHVQTVQFMRSPRATEAKYVVLPEVALRTPSSGWAFLGQRHTPPTVTLIDLELQRRLEAELGFVPSMALMAVAWLHEQLDGKMALDLSQTSLRSPNRGSDSARLAGERRLCDQLHPVRDAADETDHAAGAP